MQGKHYTRCVLRSQLLTSFFLSIIYLEVGEGTGGEKQSKIYEMRKREKGRRRGREGEKVFFF